MIQLGIFHTRMSPPVNSAFRPRQALFLALSGIGNLLMQAPTLTLFKHRFPHCQVTVWVAPRGTRALADALPSVDHVIEAPIRQPIWRHTRRLWHLSRQQFDVGIMLSPGQRWKGAAYLYLAGIPLRLGHSYPFRGNPASHFLLTHAVSEQPAVHDIEQNLALLSLIGVPINSATLSPYTFPLPAEARARAAGLIASLPRDRTLLGIHPGSSAGFEWKRWPLERFVAVGQRLIRDANAHIVVFGGPDETALKEAAYRHLKPAATVISTDLLTTAAVMQQCRVMLTNDSGLMHLAAAVGVPTLGLFGPTDEKLVGPRGPQSMALRAIGTAPVYDTEHHHALGSEAHETLLAITPELVVNRMQSFLRS